MPSVKERTIRLLGTTQHPSRVLQMLMRKRGELPGGDQLRGAGSRPRSRVHRSRLDALSPVPPPPQRAHRGASPLSRSPWCAGCSTSPGPATAWSAGPRSTSGRRAAPASPAGGGCDRWRARAHAAASRPGRRTSSLLEGSPAPAASSTAARRTSLGCVPRWPTTGWRDGKASCPRLRAEA